MPTSYYYARVKVSGTANAETLEVILTSTEEEPKKVEAVAAVEVTAVENHDAILGAYIEREQILDMALVSTLRQWDSDIRLAELSYIELGHDLPVGQSFKVGHTSGGTASDIEYTVMYSISR